MARFARLKDVKRGDFFVLPTRQEVVNLPIGEFDFDFDVTRVRVRGEYDRSSKKYSCYLFCDVFRESFISGNTFVIVDFIL